MITQEQAVELKQLAELKVHNRGYAEMRRLHDMDMQEWDAKVEASDEKFDSYLEELLSLYGDYKLSEGEYLHIKQLMDEWDVATKAWRKAEYDNGSTSGPARLAKEAPFKALFSYIEGITFIPQNPQEEEKL